MSWLRRSWRRLQAGPKFDLSYILARANPEASLPDRVLFCENLLDWVRYTGGGKTTPIARLRFLLQLLTRKPEWKVSSSEVIRSVFAESMPYSAFYETGLPHGGTFTREVLIRFIQTLLPVSEESDELSAVLTRVFYDPGDSEWIAAIPAEYWNEIIDEWIFPDRGMESPRLAKGLADAALTLSVQAAAIALRTDFASRSREIGLESHPFLHLEANLVVLSAHARRDPQIRDRQEIQDAFLGVCNEIGRARSQIRSVRTRLEESGVSVDLVYQMDRMKLYLERIELLSRTLTTWISTSDSKALRQDWIQLFTALVEGIRYDKDFSFVVRKSTRLLSMKVVERTGSSGEHYFTSTWKEWRHLFWAAAGGGALTAFTALAKSFSPHSPLFLEFMYSGLNYSISFVLMHFLGLKLATKQPSMTAAALAGRLSEDGKEKGTEFAEEVAQITRAQFAAVAGNLIFVVPMVFILDLCWKGLYGIPFYSAQKAVQMIDSVRLLSTGTMAFAAWTGVILWVASLGAGFSENFVVFMHVKKLIAGNRMLKRWFGAERALMLGDGIVRHAAGVSGSVLLGFMLAGTPIFAKFFGLPIDVRHVTLTTGSLAFSYLSLGSPAGMLTSFGSVLVIGLLNFGVSFSLAIFVALRARNADLKRAMVLFRTSRLEFFTHPVRFFFPVTRKGKGK